MLSERHHARLSYGGKELPAPRNVNDHHKTPWGKLYWFGPREAYRYWYGWMPKPHHGRRMGKLLPRPD